MPILFLIPAVFIVVLVLIYIRAFYSPIGRQNDIYNIPPSGQYAPFRKWMQELVRELDSKPYEAVEILSRDGLLLRGRYYHCADGAPLDIAFHGYRGTAVRDMCGGIRISWQLGHNVLLVDQRAHGRSRGHTITFGIKERQDCLCWVEYAKQRFGSDVRILLYGVSMGAATVLMASDMDFGGNVRGVIADSPYDSPEEIIRKVCRDMHLPDGVLWPLIALAARVLGRFRIGETCASRAAGRSALPILILHGGDDRFVPSRMSEGIAAARSGIRRYVFPGAAHGISALVDAPRYSAIVIDFMRRCLE